MKQENKITSNFLLIYDNKPLVLNSTEKTIKDIKNSLLSLYNLSSYDYVLYFDEDCENIIKNDELKLTNISKIYMEKIDTNNLELNKIYNFLRKKDELLGSKKERETEDFNIKYYVNDNKIEKKFVPDIDELYNFFNDKNTQVVISKVDDSKISKEENTKNNMIPFDYDEFKKKNNINDNINNFEDFYEYIEKYEFKKSNKDIKEENNFNNLYEENEYINAIENDDNNLNDESSFELENKKEEYVNLNDNLKIYKTENREEEFIYYNIKKEKEKNDYIKVEYKKNDSENNFEEIIKNCKNSYKKISSFFNKKFLTNENKKEIHQFILDLNLDKYDYIKNGIFEKINIILDLDNTLIHTFIPSPEETNFVFNKLLNLNKEKNIFKIDLINNNKNFVVYFILRKGIKNFFNKLKYFCNFYINSSGRIEYVKAIAKKIEKECNIKITKIIAREDEKANIFKNFNEFEIDYSNSIIIDDKIDVWNKYKVKILKKYPSSFILVSKIFFNQGFMNLSNEIQKKKYKDLNSNINFDFNIIDEKNWMNTKILKYKYEFSDLNKILTIENYLTCNLENESNNQLEFYANFIKKIFSLRNFFFNYCLNNKYNSSIISDKLINLLRINIFYNKIFNIDYVDDEKKIIIKNIIFTLGGKVFEPDDIYDLDIKPTHYIISDSNTKINNQIKKNKSLYYLINENYIFDSYYLLSELDEKDEKYSYNI